MKNLLLLCSFFIITINLKAQANIKVLEKSLKGTWDGTIEYNNDDKELTLVVTKVQLKLSGKYPISGYTTVFGKNKTFFSGTTQIVNGYVEMVLKKLVINPQMVSLN